jgi:hypothetical protein
MTVIAELVAALTYKVDDRELTKAEKAAKESAKKSAEAWDKVGTAITKVGAAALGAGAGMLAFVERSAASGAAIDDAAKRANVGAREYQRLAFAVEQAGGKPEQLAIGFRTLAKGITEARTGTGPAAEAFKKLGINVADFGRMNAEQRFAALADALSGVHDTSARTALSMTLLGEAGVALGPAFADGSAGLRKAGDEAERLGIVMSDSAVEGAAKLDEEIGKVKAQLGSMARDIGLALAPAVQGMARDWQSWAVAVGALGVAVGGAKLAALPGQLGLAANGFASMAAKIGGATVAAAALGVALGTALDKALGLSDALSGVTNTEGTRGAGSFRGDLSEGDQSELILAERERDSIASMDASGAFAGVKASRLRAAQDRVDEINARGRKRRKTVEAGAAGLQAVDSAVAEDLTIRTAREGNLVLVGAQATAALTASATKIAKQNRPKGGGKSKKEIADAKAKADSEAQARDMFGTEIDMLAEKFGAGDVARQAAIEAAGASLLQGDVQDVARQAALSRLGSSVGETLTTKSKRDPKLSAIFGEDVPDIELSALARGTEPQVLISTINNTFTFDNQFDIDGTADPDTVAHAVADVLHESFQAAIDSSSKTVKVKFAR